jgi:hypothetical protein
VPSLHDLQTAFAQGLLRPEDSEKVLAEILADHFQPDERLQIYRNNLFISLREALAAVFPAILNLVGEDFFAATARAFVREKPPRSGNLHDFGSDYADFLAHLPQASALRYLPDVARLEWAWHECYHATQASPFDFAALARVAPQDYARLRFRLQAGARLLESDFPVVRIWEVNQPDYAGDRQVILGQGGQQALVARIGGNVVVQAVNRGRFECLLALSRGDTLADASIAAANIEPDFDLDGALRDFVSQDIIVEFEL